MSDHVDVAADAPSPFHVDTPAYRRTGARPANSGAGDHRRQLPIDGDDVDVTLTRRNTAVYFTTRGRQNDALALPSVTSWLPLFACDTAPENGADRCALRRHGGRKTYTRASYDEFYRRYVRTPPSHRWWYEILLEDAWTHLYIDLDASLVDNPTVDVDALCRRLCVLMRAFLATSYPTVVRDPERDVRFVRLDSGTAAKMSVHYVVKVRAAAFQDLKHCGAFMRHFQLYVIRETSDGDVATSPFFVWRSGHRPDPMPSVTTLRAALRRRASRPPLESIVDMAVYTRYRAFRLYGSHKAGADARRRKLWLHEEAATRTGDDGDIAVVDRDTFLDCMVQRFEPTEVRHVLRCTEWNGDVAQSTNRRWDHIYPASSTRLAAAPRRLAVDTGVKRTSAPSSTHRTGDGAVPADLERRLCGFVAHRHQCTALRARYNFETATLTVSLDSRQCAIARREHRGNHIYAVVRLDRGTWYQKCYGCDGRRGDAAPLPDTLGAECRAFMRMERNREQTFIGDVMIPFRTHRTADQGAPAKRARTGEAHT